MAPCETTWQPKEDTGDGYPGARDLRLVRGGLLDDPSLRGDMFSRKEEVVQGVLGILFIALLWWVYSHFPSL